MLNRIITRTSVLEKAMDASWLRSEMISNNIANVDTPGYKKKTVHFEEYLEKALDQNEIKGFTNHKNHIQIGRSSIDEVPVKVSEDHSLLNYRLDENNVDIENEMASQAKNTIQYNTLTQKLNGEFRKIKSVIGEGRR